jgi:hypothetical protein
MARLPAKPVKRQKRAVELQHHSINCGVPSPCAISHSWSRYQMDAGSATEKTGHGYCGLRGQNPEG